MPIVIVLAESEEQLQSAFDIRTEVFIKEQKVSKEEGFDGKDGFTPHYLALDGDKVIGTFRLMDCDDSCLIQRLAVLKEWRGKGVGEQMMNRALEIIKDQGYEKAILDSQVYAIGFYQKFGFQVKGKEFLDAGIPHMKMFLNLEQTP